MMLTRVVRRLHARSDTGGSFGAGGIQFPAPASAVQLGIENLVLNVSGKQVTNCAVPCYFAACYLEPGADPPGTYKFCAEARVALANWPAGRDRNVQLQLIAPDGSTAFNQTVFAGGAADTAARFVQVPLYSAPRPLPPGSYRLSAQTADRAAQAVVTVQIQWDAHPTKELRAAS